MAGGDESVTPFELLVHEGGHLYDHKLWEEGHPHLRYWAETVLAEIAVRDEIDVLRRQTFANPLKQQLNRINIELLEHARATPGRLLDELRQNLSATGGIWSAHYSLLKVHTNIRGCDWLGTILT